MPFTSASGIGNCARDDVPENRIQAQSSSADDTWLIATIEEVEGATELSKRVLEEVLPGT
jgi:hypothetical protein